MNRFFIIIFCMGLLLSSCQPPRPGEIRAEIGGTKAQRVSEAVRILSKYGALPGEILDASMEEVVHDNSGGRIPGPSDSTLTGKLTVRALQLEAWRKYLEKPLADKPDTKLSDTPSWWPGPADFSQAEFYEVQKLAGRPNGFAALLPGGTAGSKIVFHAFTR